MLRIIIILLLLQFQELLLQSNELLFSQTIYPYLFNRPTPQGIDQYINDNKYRFICEFQQYVKDTLVNDVDITAEDLSKLTSYTGVELGWTEIYSDGFEIMINDIKEFRDYSISINRPKIRKLFIESDQFVKSTIFHELMHVYVRQEMLRLIMMKDTATSESKLNKYYYNIQLVPNSEISDGATFIEEGLCEYLIHKKGEVLEYKNMYIPHTEEDIIAKINRFNVYYKYSYEYLKPFLDSCIVTDGRMRPAIHILLTNNPPNHQENLTPSLYFNRLK